jgi:hypothetical protein
MEQNTVRLIKRALLFGLLVTIISFILCLILKMWGLKIFMVCGTVGSGFVLIWLACWLNDKGKLDTSKIVIFILIYIGAMMAGFSYYLAYIEREEIAESLSKAALVELVAPAVMFLLKSLIENLSINNKWPDKSCEQKKDNENPPI